MGHPARSTGRTPPHGPERGKRFPACADRDSLRGKRNNPMLAIDSNADCVAVSCRPAMSRWRGRSRQKGLLYRRLHKGRFHLYWLLGRQHENLVFSPQLVRKGCFRNVLDRGICHPGGAGNWWDTGAGTGARHPCNGESGPGGSSRDRSGWSSCQGSRAGRL